tara:strand:+ start:33 stop:1283 length:1251 start_codon:yes stop_codon:yes gene_type:complete
MTEVEIPLTEPQEEFVFSEDSRPGLVGGLGSGKSRGGTMRLLYLMMVSPGCDTAYYMPTYDLLKLRAIPGVEDDLRSLGLNYSLNKSDYQIDIAGLGSMIFRSYDNPNRIVAYEVAHSICDELDTLPMEKAEIVWRKINERNRQDVGTPNTIGLVTTPDQGMSGFVYKKWVEERAEGYSLIKAPTYSNPYLPDSYIEDIRKNYDEKLANMFIEGEFVVLSQNKVYHYFDRELHDTGRELERGDVAHISIDFNIGGCCSTVTIFNEFDDPETVDEFVTNDTYDFVNYLKHHYDGYDLVVYPDASGKAGSTNAKQSDIDIIKGAGYRVDVKDSNPKIKDRVNAVNKLLSHENIKVNTKKCKRLTNALESQGYDKKGDPEKFSNHPAIDDWNDSWGYFIARRFPIRSRQSISKLNIQGF